MKRNILLISALLSLMIFALTYTRPAPAHAESLMPEPPQETIQVPTVQVHRLTHGPGVVEYYITATNEIPDLLKDDRWKYVGVVFNVLPQEIQGSLPVYRLSRDIVVEGRTEFTTDTHYVQ